MDNVVKVGMADMCALKHPGMLTTLGLGSCVGIALYDSREKVIGLAHIMLPSSTQARNTSNVAKFADTAVERLMKDMIKLGAKKRNIVAKLAGGAQMFAFASTSDIMRIGSRNVEAVKQKLRDMNISIVAEHTGGNFGRTVEFYSGDGRFLVKTIGRGIKQI